MSQAYVERRPRRDGSTGFRVQWRQGHGRAASKQSESFDSERAATRFKLAVEEAGMRWPDGWVKGVGWRTQATRPDGAGTGTGTDFQAFAATYLNTRRRAQPDTLARYRAQVLVLAAHFPTVESVDDQAIATWVAGLQAAGRSAKTIANYHGLLFAVLGYAVKKSLRTTNPCADTQLPDRRREQAEVITALTEAEYAVLRAHVHADVADLVEVAVGTGARWGELTALRVGDLDLDAATPTLRIVRAWKRTGTPRALREPGEGRYVLGPPKSRRSIRTVTLAPPVVAALRRAVADKGPDDLVFTAPQGGPWRQPDFYRGRWQVAVAAARRDGGLAKAPRFHDLRHTHAVWLITAGVPLPVIQARLGHDSIQVTVDVYGGFLAAASSAADAAITTALAGQQVRPRLRVVDAEPAATGRPTPAPPAAAAR